MILFIYYELFLCVFFGGGLGMGEFHSGCFSLDCFCYFVKSNTCIFSYAEHSPFVVHIGR